MTRFHGYVALLLLAFLAATAPAQSTTVDWSGGANGGDSSTWDTTYQNWNTAVTTPWDSINGYSNVASFTTPVTPTVSGDVHANGINFSAVASVTGGTIHFGGDTPTVTYASQGSHLSSQLTGDSGLTISSNTLGDGETGALLYLDGSQSNTFGNLTLKNTAASQKAAYQFVKLAKTSGASAFSGDLYLDGGSGLANLLVAYLVTGSSIPTGAVINFNTNGSYPRLSLSDFNAAGNSIEIGGLASTGSSQGFSSVSAGYGYTPRPTHVTTLTINNSADYAFGGQLLDNLGGIKTPLAIVKKGAGTQTLNGLNTYTGSTAVDGGTLLVNGTIAGSGVSVADGATLGGYGNVNTAISGAGLVSPGNSPGILTTTSIDPTGGLDFAFEMTSVGSPNYAQASASLNDVLHLTAETPTTDALTSANVVDVYFSVASLADGDTFRGGAYINSQDPTAQTTFLAAVEGATYDYYVLGDGAGTDATFNDIGYYSLANYNSAITVALSVVSDTAAFASGSVDGSVMQFQVVVPEPGTFALFAAGLIGLLAYAWRKRK